MGWGGEQAGDSVEVEEALSRRRRGSGDSVDIITVLTNDTEIYNWRLLRTLWNHLSSKSRETALERLRFEWLKVGRTEEMRLLAEY